MHTESQGFDEMSEHDCNFSQMGDMQESLEHSLNQQLDDDEETILGTSHSGKAHNQASLFFMLNSSSSHGSIGDMETQL